MIPYKDYEKRVYDWLMSKHNQDPTFTFSFRQKASKGAEKDYFIGTEKSNYFSTSFWYLPVAFPGSSGDCIGLQFYYTKTGYNYFFEFTQTQNPHNEQNKAALALVKAMQPALASVTGFQRIPTANAKMFTLRTKTRQDSYDSLEAMFIDIEKDMAVVIPIVNKTIAEIKDSYPQFEAHRIATASFESMHQKMEMRMHAHSVTVNDSDTMLSTSKKYWLYAPGENANKWDEFYEAGIMGLGWDQLGDLNNYTTKEAILAKLQAIENTTSNKGNDTTANIDFKSTISVGDIVIAKKGRKEYIGYGIVTSDYYYDASRLDYQKCRKVNWIKRGQWEEENKDIVLKTLTDITKYPDYVTKLIDLLGIADETNPPITATGTNRSPLNQILYGPPGTGKTYNTVLEAAKIITGNEAIGYAEALKVFNANLGQQIEFITFHQNYSYEDFIQGLRPDTENGSALTFEKKDGVFKRIADRAMKNLEASQNPASAKKDFDLVFSELIQPLNEGDVTEIEIKMKKSSFFITAVGEKSIDFRKSIGDSEHTLSINTLRKMYDKGVNDIILGGLQPYYNPILELLLEKGKSTVTAVARQNYVIIIDEINRANISRVFGELITLIEEDKRSHGAIPMRVTLPSGDPFIVPSNLYIIGTMNTADKSIALLDIALRRRFEFVPKYPDVALVKEEYKLLFEKMNAAIKEKKNHDFTVGHAYFMEDRMTLNQIINHKVIPLLLEYFMNSDEQVIEIMAQAGVKVGDWPLQMME